MPWLASMVKFSLRMGSWGLGYPWYSESLFVCYRVMCVLFEKMVRVFCSVLVLLEVFLQQNQCPSSIHIFNWCWWGLTDRNQLVHQRFTLNSLSTLSVPAQQSVGQICRTSNPSDIACIATQFSGFVNRFVLEAHIITIGIYRTLYLCTAPCPRKIIWSPKCDAFICLRISDISISHFAVVFCAIFRAVSLSLCRGYLF